MSPIIMLEDIARLKLQGASLAEIAAECGLTEQYIRWVTGTDGFVLVMQRVKGGEDEKPAVQ